MDELQLAPEIAERASLTNWTDDRISTKTWDLLFEAARRAPSSWNHQPARYVAVTERKQIRAVCGHLHRTNRWAVNAAGLVVQVARPEDDDCVDGKEYYLYDCGLAMMSLVYQAQALGITSRQMIGWEEAPLKELLGIPASYRIVVVTGLGYPSEGSVSSVIAQLKRHGTAQHKRYSVEHLRSWERWGGMEP